MHGITGYSIALAFMSCIHDLFEVESVFMSIYV